MKIKGEISFNEPGPSTDPPNGVRTAVDALAEGMGGIRIHDPSADVAHGKSSEFNYNNGVSERTRRCSTVSTGSKSDSSSTNSSRTPIPNLSFFHRFPGFTPIPNATFEKKLSALAAHQGLSKKKTRLLRYEALQAEFDSMQGTDTTKLAGWQNLCEQVGIEEKLTSITQCRKALGSRKVMVNLTNLIDHVQQGTDLIKFKNFDEFRQYTLRPQHNFPRKLAKQDGFIKALLRHVV